MILDVDLVCNLQDTCSPEIVTKPETVTKTFNAPGGNTKTVTVELFTWEKLDFVEQVKTAFGL